METIGAVAGISGILVLAGAIWWTGRYTIKKRQRRAAIQTARALFRQRREWLEARFLTRAAQSGKPRSLVWSGCEFADAVAFARDRNSGQLRALVAVTISFRAEEGGDMVDVEAVGALRAATAVFRFDGQHWSSEGQTIFNLNPAETIERFQHELEVVE